MPTSLNSIADDEMNIRWKEPLLTEALNHKAQVVIPRGVYRGFALSTHVNPLTVSVTTDSSNLHVAQYEPANGYTLQIRRTGGTFALDLTALASTTVVIGIYAKYSVGNVTTGEIRAYTAAEWAANPPEKNEVVVLGTVVVPASGVIAAASITPAGRVMAWANTAAEAQSWTNVVRNGGFQVGYRSFTSSPDMVPPWFIASNGAGTLGTDFSVIADTTQGAGPYGTNLSLEIQVAGAASHSFLVTQAMSVPVRDGQRLRLRFMYRAAQVPTTGQILIALSYEDASGALTVFPAPLNLATTNANIDRLWDLTGVVPTGYTRLVGISFIGSPSGGPLKYASTGTAWRVSDINLWVEGIESLVVSDDERMSAGEVVTRLFFDTPGVLHALRGDQAKIVPTTNGLVVRRRDNAFGMDWHVPDGAVFSGDTFSYESARTRTFMVPPLGIRPGLFEVVAGTSAGLTTPGAQWKLAEQAVLGPPDLITSLDFVVATSRGHEGTINLNPYLRTGQTLTKIEALVDPATAQATVGNRISVYALKRNMITFAAATAIGSTATDDGTANQQIIPVGGFPFSEVIDLSTYSYSVVIVSSQGANTAPGDRLYGLRISISETEVRNY